MSSSSVVAARAHLSDTLGVPFDPLDALESALKAAPTTSSWRIAALRVRRGVDVLNIEVASPEDDDGGLHHLVEALAAHGSRVKALRLKCWQPVFASRVVEHLTHAVVLDVWINPVEDGQILDHLASVEALARAVAKCPCVESLALNWADLDDEAGRILGSPLQEWFPRIRRLDIKAAYLGGFLSAV